MKMLIRTLEQAKKYGKILGEHIEIKEEKKPKKIKKQIEEEE